MSEELLHACSVTGLIFGGMIAILNFYLSSVRYFVLRWLGWPDRFASGFPIIGSLLLVPAAVWFALAWNPWLLACTLLLVALDTGGIAWFAPIFIREYLRK